MFSSWSCTPVVHNGIWCTQWNMVYTILLFLETTNKFFKSKFDPNNYHGVVLMK